MATLGLFSTLHTCRCLGGNNLGVRWLGLSTANLIYEFRPLKTESRKEDLTFVKYLLCAKNFCYHIFICVMGMIMK